MMYLEFLGCHDSTVAGSSGATVGCQVVEETYFSSETVYAICATVNLIDSRPIFSMDIRTMLWPLPESVEMSLFGSDLRCC